MESCQDESEEIEERINSAEKFTFEEKEYIPGEEDKVTKEQRLIPNNYVIAGVRF